MDKLGINPIQIIAYIIIFFVLYIFARKFVRKVLETTALRQRIIEEGLENAKKTEVLKAEKLVEAEEEKRAVIQQAYDHANEIIEKTKIKESKIIAEAQEKAKTLLADASTDLEDLRAKKQEEGLKDAKEIISLSIKKAFGNIKIDQATEEKLIQESLNNLTK
jgi:F0F1-type ATP synthase membrane subunit b/b'